MVFSSSNSPWTGGENGKLLKWWLILIKSRAICREKKENVWNKINKYLHKNIVLVSLNNTIPIHWAQHFKGGLHSEGGDISAKSLYWHQGQVHPIVILCVLSYDATICVEKINTYVYYIYFLLYLSNKG